MPEVLRRVPLETVPLKPLFSQSTPQGCTFYSEKPHSVSDYCGSMQSHTHFRAVSSFFLNTTSILNNYNDIKTHYLDSGDHMINKFIQSATLLLLLSLRALPLESVEISIQEQFIAFLDSNPYYDTAFYGTFTSQDSVYPETRLNYRGAYSLYNLIRSGDPQRNWKVKIPKGDRYRDYRVWNYNYEPFINQNLAYLLMHDAGVPCINMRQVMLYVNDSSHGLYSEYPDPDNKDWLKVTFGSHTDSFVGDLFKAATDRPDLIRKYFADLTILGENDSDYYLHFNKKTNDSTEQAENDYSSIRHFIKVLNETPDAEFADTISRYFDVHSFLRYLVVANYIAFWDGYPNRAKNYWLYLNPHTQKWTFIPWDLDATFDPFRFALNNMGAECRYLFMYGVSDLNSYYTRSYRTSNNGSSEISPRPLFTRIMDVPEFRDLYAVEYKRALSTYLDKETLLAKIDSIGASARGELSESDLELLEESVMVSRSFVERRSENLEQQLGAVTAWKPNKHKQSFRNPHLSRSGSRVHVFNPRTTPVTCTIYSLTGRVVHRFHISSGSSHMESLCSGTSALFFEIREYNTGAPLLSRGSFFPLQ